MGCNSSKNTETSNQNKPEEKTENQEQDIKPETGEDGRQTNTNDPDSEQKRQRMLSVFSVTNDMASSEFEELKRDLLPDVMEKDEDQSSQQGDSNVSDSAFETQEGEPNSELKVQEDGEIGPHNEGPNLTASDDQKDQIKVDVETTGPNTTKLNQTAVKTEHKEVSQTESVEELKSEGKKPLQSESLMEECDKTKRSAIEDCDKLSEQGASC